MKNFNKIFISVIVFIISIFIFSNIFIFSLKGDSGRPYRIEINRLAEEITQNGFENINLSKFPNITNVESYDNTDEFYYGSNSDYAIRKINEKLYRFDYINDSDSQKKHLAVSINIILGVMSLLIILVLIYTRRKILKPFERLTDVPYELSKGNLTVPIKENKNHFFGKFIWGVDLLRENIEKQKQHELSLQKDKKTLLLSISHDIKTPLSAIKLYSKALSKGLYTDKNKQNEIAESINAKADEIEVFVSQIIKASSNDFLNFEVNNSEFYLSTLIEKIKSYYTEKLFIVQIDFLLGNYIDCILKGDIYRSVEVLQNLIENAIKYGDGKFIRIDFSEEENCQLVTVSNSGCTLSENEMPHIFESFWQGSNTDGKGGSGLGLYICRNLMRKMNGDIFAETENNTMKVTAVFVMA